MAAYHEQIGSRFLCLTNDDFSRVARLHNNRTARANGRLKREHLVKYVGEKRPRARISSVSNRGGCHLRNRMQDG